MKFLRMPLELKQKYLFQYVIFTTLFHLSYLFNSLFCHTLLYLEGLDIFIAVQAQLSGLQIHGECETHVIFVAFPQINRYSLF